MRGLEAQIRRWQIRALRKIDPRQLAALGTRRLARQARRIALRVPAYGRILRELGVAADQLRSAADVLERCPVLAKEDLFGRFPLHELCLDGQIAPLASVLTSSGQGGRFAFGLSTLAQSRALTQAVDLGLEYAFQTDSRRTLLINALPMGVRFSSRSVTVAETSVREDMVTALVREVAPYYEQTILVLDPLFCKRLLDHARDSGLDWSGRRIHAILGEETFGERFRDYVARQLGQDPEGWTRGFIGSSMGVGELGLNLFFETRETVRLRQLAQSRPELMTAAIGPWPGCAPPMLFVYDPRRIYVEVVADAAAPGFGALVVSTLDPGLMLPLLRYRTGDRARLIDRHALQQGLAAGGIAAAELPPLPMIAVSGRERDQLKDGRTLLDLKEALYACPDVADHLSGAFRIEQADSGALLHAQARRGSTRDRSELAARLAAQLPPREGAGRGEDQAQVWEYASFPFGQGLDYERKLDYLGR